MPLETPPLPTGLLHGSNNAHKKALHGFAVQGFLFTSTRLSTD